MMYNQNIIAVPVHILQFNAPSDRNSYLQFASPDELLVVGPSSETVLMTLPSPEEATYLLRHSARQLEECTWIDMTRCLYSITLRSRENINTV
jgi:hypothetical protein